MNVTSLVASVAPSIDKTIENVLNVFEIWENLLQKWLLSFVFRLSQLVEIALKS